MKRVFYTLILLFTICAVDSQAQNVFDPADPDVIFTPSYRPDPPPYGVLAKWGHKNAGLGWNPYNAGYKSYFYNGTAFRLKFPRTYVPGVADGKKYPIYVFLHGAGEPGDYWDNELQLLHGGQTHATNVDNGKFDGYLIYPQSQSQWTSGLLPKVEGIIDSLVKYAKGDPDRVIVGGLSAGASAVFSFLTSAPEKWAAITPISSAAIDVNTIKNYLSTPIWISNGGKDKNPSPGLVQDVVDAYQNQGGDVRHSFYPNSGHNVWNAFWAEPGYFAYLSNAHKAQPVVKFNRTEWCPSDPIHAVMILQPGFYQYEWQKNDTTIAGANKDSLIATSYGTYKARFKRTASSDWSDWSPRPVVIGPKGVTVTPPITIKGMRSDVLPAPDGSTTVPLMVPTGYATYEWRRVSDNALLSDSNVLIAPVGSYKVRVMEEFGCSSVFSDPYTVIAANGTNVPDKPTDASVITLSNTSLEVLWNDNPTPAYNETGFEVYRSTVSGSGYQLIAKIPADSLSLVDAFLEPNTTYYYVIRSVNANGASGISNEASGKTFSDNTPPTIPNNLRMTAISRTSVGLAWDESFDDVGIKNYEVYINGTKAFVTNTTDFIVNGLDSFTNYAFYVRAVDFSGNKSAPSAQLSAFTKYNGWNYSVYQGDWDLLPDFSVLTPVLRGITPNISLSVSPFVDYFGMVWEASIYAPTNGNYTFYLASDDGSKLYVGKHYSPNATPLINNDGLHGTVEKTGVINLTKGWHKIAVTFFEKNGGESLRLRWRTPGAFLPVNIPDGNFVDSRTPPDAVPAKPTNLTATATAYNSVELSWQDKSSNETGFEIFRKLPADANFEIIGQAAANATSFRDSTTEGATTYTYRIQAVNARGGSGFTANVNVITPAAPAIPGTPAHLQLEALSPTSVKISFDVSGQTSVEIQRSISDDQHFRIFKVIETEDTAVVITDSSLFANTVVYYKVRATGVSGSSDFSDADSVTTLNTNPHIAPLGARQIYYMGSTIIPIAATDADGDDLKFDFVDLPAFATFDSTGRGTGNLVFNTDPTYAGTYNIGVSVQDGFGGTASETLEVTVSNNRPPVFGRVLDMEVHEGQSVSRAVSALDPDRRAELRYELYDAPSFVEGRTTGNSFSLIATPGYSDAGEYQLRLHVTDGRGGFDSVAIALKVLDVNPSTMVYMNVLRDAPAPPAPWNNLTQSSTPSLLDQNGNPTGISLTFSPSGWYTSADGAVTGDNSGAYPDLVIRDNYYFGLSWQPDTVYLSLDGLQPDENYRLTLFSSSTFGTGSTAFETGGQQRTISVKDNTSEKAVFNQLTADSTGKIVVKMSKSLGANLGYVNALVLEKPFDDGTPPATPSDLNAVPLPNGYVLVKWKNVAYNADGYTLLRSGTIDGTFEPISGDSLYAHDTSFIDKTVKSSHSYFYKLLAFNRHGTSDTIGIAEAQTLNKTPVLQPIENVYLKVGANVNVNIEASDDVEDSLTITVDGLPGFASVTGSGNGTATINIAPNQGNTGLFKDVTVTVTDNHGASSSKSFNISIADSSLRTFAINFNGTEAAPWNNFTGAANPYNTLSNMVDDVNTTTGVAFKFNTWLAGNSDFGMTDAGKGIYSDNVMGGGVFSNDTTTHAMQFSGLDQNKMYNVVIFSSYNVGTGSATVSSGGKTVTVDGRYNTTRNVGLNGLTPNSSGIIEVTFKSVAVNQIFILNALKLEEYNSGALLSPADLIAEPLVSNTSIKLNWSDRASDETGYEIYRSTSPSSGYVLVTTASPNATSYTDVATALKAGNTYYYRVRTKRGTSLSAFSNVAEFTLARSLSLLNMNIPQFEGPEPWNNTSNPTSDEGTKVSNLGNTDNIATGVDFEITQHFNGKGFEGSNVPGVFPVIVMRSNYWTDAGQVSEVKFSGLDLRQTYRVGVFNSVIEVTGNYFGIYTVNGITKTVNGQGNNFKILYFDDVAPNADGEIEISVTPDTRWSPYCFTNAFTLEGYIKPGSEFGSMRMTEGDLTDGPSDIAPEPQVSVAKPAVREMFGAVNLRAYPNPFVASITADIELPSGSSSVILELFDMHSRLIFKKDVGNNGGFGGRKTVSLPVAHDLAPGVYILKLTANGEQKTIKLLKTR